MRRLLVLVVVFVGLAYAVGGALFLGKTDDDLVAVDAVVVLAGNSRRLPVAVDLVTRVGGVVPTLVVSNDLSGRDPARARLCRAGLEGVEVVCLSAAPYTTRGEARMVARLARTRGWDAIAIVTSRYHLFRAERIFGRCTDAELVMRGAATTLWQKVVAVPLEWAKLGLALTARRSC
jgi:uncharacterized SAM-binding protein YcdF (DUF218 family)